MSKGRIGLVGLALVHLTCGSVLLTAPPGTTLTLFANPPFISANGGVSVITAFLIEAAGTPVADGTVVQFFTTLGRIDQRGKTSAGVARVNLVADSRSGTAKVTAVSGGTPAAPNPTPSGTPPPPTSAGLNSAAVTITIGNANAASAVLSANPPSIGSSRSTFVTCTVFDGNGNPLRSVPVFFVVDPATGTESFDSGGAPIFTDNDGRAMDVLRTRNPLSGSVNVTARVPNAGGFVKPTPLTLTIPIN